MDSKSKFSVDLSKLNQKAIVEILHFCSSNQHTAANNKIWLISKLALENPSGDFSADEKKEFALFTDQLIKLVTAVYDLHQPNKATLLEQEGKSDD